MRNVEYLSPSSIQKFEEGMENFYLQYLAENRPPREPQNQAMSIGSAFDAYTKSFLHDALFGKNHEHSSKFDFDTIFTSQVEEHNRDWARMHGKYAFNIYKSSSGLHSLLKELQAAVNPPRFEFELRGSVNGYRDGKARVMGQVTLLGKPDAVYKNRDGNTVILDWKVNGWCSNHAHSPMPGFIAIRDHSGYNVGPHKNATLVEHGSMTINTGTFLEEHKIDWARQLAIYAWLLDEPIGGDFIVAIDQLCCKPTGSAIPLVRVAEHRLRISEGYQFRVFNRACEIWEIVHSNHIFREMSVADSQARCKILDERADSLYGANMDADFLEFTRR